VYIDYLQLMKGRGGNMNREQEVSEISRGLKGLAKECKVNVTALSQLNRAVETRSKGGKGGRPVMSDLRESGSLEQDADVIMFIYRDEYYNAETTKLKGIAEVNIAKQRQGETGRIYLRFTGQYTRFDNLAPGEQVFDDEGSDA
jgi:replicative DNA helicase